jgi:hypothetical protein
VGFPIRISHAGLLGGIEACVANWVTGGRSGWTLFSEDGARQPGSGIAMTFIA